MWKHQSETHRGWKYSITSNKYIVQITGGSITIRDRRTQLLLKKDSGHRYLYTGDISPDESQCFALENGKHFYVYFPENVEFRRRVTLPRGYECIDMQGHYSEDGRSIEIPTLKWVGDAANGDGHYEYILCRYDAQNFSLIEKSVIEDPASYQWK